MQQELKDFIKAGWKLSLAWDEEQVENYPEYLPSFDEFLSEFTHVLEGKTNEQVN